MNPYALKQDVIRTAPLPPWPVFAADEIAAVTRVLQSGHVNYWTGPEGRAFEKEFAAFCGVNHAVALANGTVALELALHVLGVGPGDEVITSSRTFIASASCIVMRGATPIIADVDPVSQNITAETIRPLITPRTRAIVAVHLAGWPCDMAAIMALAREHSLYVIEDCAQAHGARYRGKPVGSLGHMAAFSFCQDKIMTTGGEGGMLVTNNLSWWEKAWSFKDHGKSYNAVYHRRHPPGFRWLHDSFGTNWRMTEMQAAIGRVQLGKLPEWTAIRQQHSAVLNDCCRNIPALRVPEPDPEVHHACYKYYVFVRPGLLREGWNRDRVMNAVTAEGIPCFSGSCSEIYLEKAFIAAGFSPRQPMPVARQLGETSLMFMIHPTLTTKDIEETCLAITKVMAAASR